MTDHDIAVAAADLAYVTKLRGEITDLTLACQCLQARIALLETQLDQAYIDAVAALLERVAQLELYRDRLEHERNATRERFMQQQARLDQATIRIGYLERMSELLRAAVQTAAALLSSLDRRGRLGLDVHQAIGETRKELDVALTATATATTILARLTVADTLAAAERGRDVARAEYEAMRRTASALADEKGHVAIELLDAQLEANRLRAELATAQADAAVLWEYADHKPGCPLWNDLRGECTCGYAALNDHPGISLLTELERARIALLPFARLCVAYDGLSGPLWPKEDGDEIYRIETSGASFAITLGDLRRAREVVGE